MHQDFEKPAGLTRAGERAYAAIAEFIGKLDTEPKYPMSGGGCRAFYSPKEWLEERREEYGKGSVLIIVYDGGDLRPYFNLDAAYEGDCLYYHATGKPNPEPYGTYERMRKHLDAAGFYTEECTGWYCAVYTK